MGLRALAFLYKALLRFFKLLILFHERLLIYTITGTHSHTRQDKKTIHQTLHLCHEKLYILFYTILETYRFKKYLIWTSYAQVMHQTTFNM